MKTSGSQCQKRSPNPTQTANPQQLRPRRKGSFGGAFLVVGLSVLLGAATALAAPFAKRIQFPQPDGTKITLWGEGDEFYAVFETMDGYTVTFNPATKVYHYAVVAVDGSSLAPTDLQVGQGDPAALGLAKHLRISPAAIKKQVQDRFQKWDEAMQVTARWNQIKAAWQQATRDTKSGVIMAPPSFTTTGLRAGLTLLIDFSDDPATIPQANIIDFCNGDNYTGYGNNGSVKKYYFDNSNSLLTYTNVVTIYIRVPQPKTYYNNTSIDCGIEGRLLINDAITAMKALPNYTTDILPVFSALTVNGNSYVVACNVFFAGSDSGVWKYGLWPHSSALGSPVDLGNGKKVYYYQITNIGTSLELGTFCHENGHMLCGYPDIYDYGYDSSGGAGGFCLMDLGGNGGNPVQICAYLKRASGWATTTELTSTSQLTASVAASGAGFNTFYRYVKPGVSTEYFLVENRQKSGRDANLPASGVAIWHIDELGNKDNQSTNYNTSHLNYEVSLMQADNLWHFEAAPYVYGDAQDLYYLGNAATGYIDRFGDTTAPSARWWSGSTSGVDFRNFSSSATTMTFTVGPGDGMDFDPAAGLDSAGAVGGPFNPTCKTYTLTNSGTTSFNWSISANQSWITVTPGAGTLAAALATNVAVCLNSNANSLGVGNYSGTVTLTNLTSATSQSRSVTLTISPPAVYSFSLDTDPGWSRQGEWAFGKPNGLGGMSHGNPDPTSGATGTNVFGVNLNGDYSTTVGGPWYLTAGPLSFVGYTNVIMQFQRWLNTDYQPYGYATVEVSTNGTTWTQIFSNGYSEIADASWSKFQYSVSTLADNCPTVYVRWGYQVAGGAYAYSGWNIDDVEFLGSPAMTPFQQWQIQYFGSATCALCGGNADFDGDGMSNTNEFLSGTDPTNSASVFRITAEERSGADIRVSFTSVSGMYYCLSRCDFMGGGWTTLVDNIPGNGGIRQAMDIGGASRDRAFYRMRLNQSPNPALADSDGDGIPDSWMQLYFGHATGLESDHSCAGDDPDGDGKCNLQEYWTGTDPTNSASALRILAVAREGSDLRVTWFTAGGHTNVVQAAPNLGASYSDISSNVLVTSSGDTTTNYLDVGGATNTSRFYRVRLVP